MTNLSSSKGLKYAVIIVLSLVAYADQLDGEFVFDDNAAILKNELVTNPATSWWDVFHHDYWGTRIMCSTSHKSYRPLTTLTLRLEYQWHGREASPFWMKLTNFIIHLIISCLVLEFGDLFVRDNCRTSFLAAAIFSIHPVHTEAVAGIVSRADLLACLGFILAVWVYFRAFIAEANWDWKFFSSEQVVLLTLVSVLCKETGISILFVCAALDILHNTNLLFLGTSKLQDWKKLPFLRIFPLLLFSGLIIGARLMTGLPQFHLEDNPVAAIDDKLFRAINQTFLHALNAWLLLCPDWLSFDWALGCVTLIKSWFDVRLLGILVYVLVLVALSLRASIGKRRTQLSAIILIVIPFLPASGIIRVGFVIAERILYMSSIGWCLLVAIGFRKLIRFSSNHVARVFLKVAFILLLFVFVLKTRSRVAEWSTERQLYMSGLRVCPNNAKVHYNIGNIAAKQDDQETAIQFYRRAIDLYPKYEAALMNLGNLYRDRGDLDNAEHYLQRALESIKIPHKRAAAEMNMGIVMVMRKRYDDALQLYFRALEDRPHYPICHYNMGNAYLELRQMDKAQRHFETAVGMDSTLEVAWKNLLTLLYNEGKYEEVLATADKAIPILPATVELQFPKANALAKLKRYDEAERTFLEMIERRPGEAIYYANLGVLYHHWRRFHSAAAYYEHALRLDPGLNRISDALSKVKSKAI